MNPNDDLFDFEGISVEKKEEKNLLDDSYQDEYKPIQKNSKLFKYILYTTKVEIKSNSFIKVVYATSIFEIALWIVGVLLFIAAPRGFYLIWPLAVHVKKGILGLIILNHVPKTYEIMDCLYKKENLDEDRIIETIDQIVKDTFLERWNENKGKLLWYFVNTIIALLLDIVIFFIQLFRFGDDTFFMMTVTILFLMVVFIISDIIYLLWFVTLRFSFPQEMVAPINSAIIGSLFELKDMFMKYFKRQNPSASSEANNNIN